MNMMKKGSTEQDELTELIRTLIIVELGLAGVPQNNIQKIVHCNIVKVNNIMKLIKTAIK